ncbi:MAG: polysaccharide biosynthesis tyrosine autokinase [Muribaculaceae bacterium]|nr:polysaccharide biosynthesis tyrosine autokinase [Muribaculaceae bacterium]
MAKKSTSDFIDIKALLKTYLSKWYLFAISVFVCVACAALFVIIRKQDYAVRANVLITQQKDAIAEAMGGLSDLLGSDAYVEDEIFIISSHSVYRDVAKTLRLNVEHYVKNGIKGYEFIYQDYPVDIIVSPAVLDTLSYNIDFTIKVHDDNTADIKAEMLEDTEIEVKNVTLPYLMETPLGSYTVAGTPSCPVDQGFKSKIYLMGYDAAAEALDLAVHNEIASKRSNVITLCIETPTPKYGEAILNEIMAQYNARGIAQKNMQGELTGTFLDERLAILANDLSQSEMQIQQYKQEHGIIDVGVEAKYQTEKRGRLEEAYLEAQTQAEMLRLTSQFLADTANRFSLVPLNVENEGLQEAISNYNGALMRRVELSHTASPDNIEIVRLERRIDQMRHNLYQSTARATEQADVAVAEIRAEMGNNNSRMGDIPREEREFYDLRRQQSVKSQLYYFLLRRNEENALLLANAIPKGQIIDEAYTMSEPLGMSKKLILLFALVLGLCIPPALIYIRKLINNRFETRADVERITDVPILGEMCVDRSGRSMVVSSDDTTSTTELFRLMRSNLLFILTAPNDKVVLMTSSSSGEGKSFISINLAASLALLGKKVLLVGMDIRNPQLSNYLGIAPRYGLTQYLSSADIQLDQLVTTDISGIKGLDVIVAGPVPPNPAEMLLSEKVDTMFRTLRDRYDYIIVDTAPIGLVSDTFTLDRISDAAIYVCRANYTSLGDLALVNEIYEKRRLKKLSIVVNGTAAKKTYGYGKKKKG